ncbi:uncharacterized protein FIBRA_01716 [Fibroporia radiculosa]|uniref:Dipeptidyl-peptidase V n=1 Tax=Fibroporia radiculosa TaxID=599839 RepID=J4GL44_9APHY|nr:uncharacterized protein FIBRA_01716 [Fibroporia radiculosa]CCL99695.1 predicted protein [Fibroporia radiculosa]
MPDHEIIGGIKAEDKFTAHEVVSGDVISDLRLSKDAAKVVYCVAPHYKSGDHKTSALWLAETSLENSSRKITSGSSRDSSPRFHPTSSYIYFLSDRLKVGGPTQIYRIPCDATPETDPILVLPLNQSRTVNAFAISQDGKYIAFIGKPHSDKSDLKDPIAVWREEKDFASLFLVDLQDETKAVRSLVSADAHVDSFTWGPNSASIIYRLRDHSDAESGSESVVEEIVSIGTGAVSGIYKHRISPSSPTIWRQDGELVFMQNTSPTRLLSSQSVWTRSSTALQPPRHVAYGDTECAYDVVDIGADSQYAVIVGSGLETRVDVRDASHASFTAFAMTDENISDWDVKAVDQRYVFVALRSSGVTGELPDVWSGVTTKKDSGVLVKKLSSHQTGFASNKFPISKAFSWTSTDGERIEGVISHPRGVTELKSLPTVIVPHGGPTARDLLNFTLEDFAWRQFLASNGFLVFSPNYRGSTGRGDNFIKPANGGMGTLEWEDIESMIEEGTAQGLIDPDRMALAGYSQGGFLTAWGCTRPNNRFKAGVVGAGVTHWGFLAASSDVPELEAALGGAAPWTATEAANLQGSAVRDSQNVTAPLLFLHGKEDKRVPLTQAIALYRGIEREAKTAPKPTLVVYPREDHIFEEREHAQDVLERLLRHLETYLK